MPSLAVLSPRIWRSVAELAASDVEPLPAVGVNRRCSGQREDGMHVSHSNLFRTRIGNHGRAFERSSALPRGALLATEQLGLIQTTLDATREESGRIGRKDWLLFGIGTLTTLAISGAFSPAAAVYLAKLFIHEVAHLFGELAG